LSKNITQAIFDSIGSPKLEKEEEDLPPLEQLEFKKT